MSALRRRSLARCRRFLRRCAPHWVSRTSPGGRVIVPSSRVDRILRSLYPESGERFTTCAARTATIGPPKFSPGVRERVQPRVSAGSPHRLVLIKGQRTDQRESEHAAIAAR